MARSAPEPCSPSAACPASLEARRKAARSCRAKRFAQRHSLPLQSVRGRSVSCDLPERDSSVADLILRESLSDIPLLTEKRDRTDGAARGAARHRRTRLDVDVGGG